MHEISRVGPKGYIHGWIHVGGTTDGAKVFHPVHGHGTVTGTSGGHTTVAFPGGTHSFETRPGNGPARLAPRAAHERVTGASGALQPSLSASERQDLRAGAKAAKKRMTPAQFKTVEQWTGGKGMVRRIQQGTASEATARAFDEAMQQAPKVDGLVYRGVVPGSHGEKLADSLHVGGPPLNLDEPVSTSIDPRQAVSFGNTLFEIETPAASYISGIGSGYAYEQEAVMAPGRYEVVSVSTGKINYLSGGKTGPVRIIRLRDVTGGARSWRPTAAGKAAASVSRAALAASPGDEDDRARRFMAGDGLGQFKLAGKPAAAVRAGGQTAHPGDTERLHQYWVHGEGAAKIAWGTSGDFSRCVAELGKYIKDPQGYCNLAHHAALGYYPATHAAMEHKAGRADMPTDTKVKPEQRMELFRSYPLEEAHVVTRAEGDGSGRLVEAYCAVFGEAAEIMDHQGHYEEDINRAAFNKRIADVERSRAGYGLVKCIYNHGMTLYGTPSERFSTTPAVCKHISAESRGVLTRSYYLDTPLGNELLEMWREGAVSAQSFTGAIIRSSPELRPGEKYRPKGGQLPRVTRLELGLKEYGATPFPAYTGAELVGVRMSPLGTFQAAGDDEEHDEQALPPDEEAAPGEPLTRTDGEEHSARYHQHQLYRMTSEEKRKAAGLVW
jgi:phage head maturation protease